jgi:hypothetical protein
MAEILRARGAQTLQFGGGWMSRINGRGYEIGILIESLTSYGQSGILCARLDRAFLHNVAHGQRT